VDAIITDGMTREGERTMGLLPRARKRHECSSAAAGPAALELPAPTADLARPLRVPAA
jgi:hypothetical protein